MRRGVNKGITHLESYRFRLLMSAEVAKGRKVMVVAAVFKVSRSTVRKALRESNVKAPRTLAKERHRRDDELDRLWQLRLERKRQREATTSRV